MERYEFDRNIRFLVNDLSRLITSKYNRIMKPASLTRTQWRVIVHLHRNDGLTQSQLAGLLVVGKATVDGLVNRLEEENWVERRGDINDPRQNHIFLSQKGRDLGEEMIAQGRELTEQAMADLTKEEREQLIQLLGRLKASLLSIEQDVI